MPYIEDTSTHTTFPCSKVGITQTTVTVNMSSRQGFLDFTSGGNRAGIYIDNGNNINIDLPGTIVGNRQEVTFNR